MPTDDETRSAADRRAGALRPARPRAQVAGGLGRREDLAGAQPGRPGLRPRQAEGLRARDAALPVGGAARRPSQGLFGRRCDRPLPAAQRLWRPAADGLRRLRPAGREPRDPDRRASAGLDRALDRQLPRAVPGLGHLDRLEPRDRHPRARVLPLDPMDLPAALRGRPRLPHRRPGPVVSEGSDRARQRAGHRRALRALRDPGGAEEARSVVLPDHRLRRPPARRFRPARVVARARRHDAAQLDRSFGGGRGGLPLRRAQPRLPRLHHPSGHALRRDLLRARPRASAARSVDRGNRQRRGGRRVRRRRPPAVDRRARGRRSREDRGPAGANRDQPGQRRADPDVRRRLRPDGVRDRRDHGGPGPRPARLRVRAQVRPSDPAGRRPGGK